MKKYRRKDPNVKAALGIFDNDSSDSDSCEDLLKKSSKTGNNNYIALMRNNEEKKTQENIAQVMVENPNAYEYDMFYDKIQNQRNDLQNKKKEDRQSKYFGKAQKNAQRGQIEKDVIREKMAAKQLLREGKDIDTKEQYLTTSYQDMLKKNQQFEKEDDMKEKYNEMNSARNMVCVFFSLVKMN